MTGKGFRIMPAIWVLMVLFLTPPGLAAEPLRGRLFEGEAGITIATNAQDGSTIALVGRKTDQSTLSHHPFIALFDARTGLEIWRDVIPKNHSGFATGVAIAQNRVCAAWNTENPLSIDDYLFIRCYGTNDGAVLWGEEFEPPAGGTLLTNSLTMSGKALVLRLSSFGGGGEVILLDPSDGSEK